MSIEISIVIIAKNAQNTIKQVLDKLNSFDDVVLYLNNCSDDTSIIANKYKNVNIIEGEFIGFGPTKNKAAEFAKNNWILSLDADEVLDDSFIFNIKDLKLNENNVYEINRTNYYKNKNIKHCWGNDVIVRLYNKNKTQFTNSKVHEKIISKNMNILNIGGFINHYPYSNISDFIVKLDRYSTIFAQDNVGKKKSSPLKAILNGGFSFFKTYFIKRGFLDGYAGLIIAFSHMATNFYKYIKLYELNKEYEYDNTNN
jgi:glycosyltransferase involved in cell wall biosynthesis